MAGSLSTEQGKLKQVFAAKSVGFDDSVSSGLRLSALTTVAIDAWPQAAVAGAGTRTQRAPPTKHASMLNIGINNKGGGLMSPSGPSQRQAQSFLPSLSPKEVRFSEHSQPQQASTDQSKNRSISRTISKYFKSLFESKSSTGSDAADSGQNTPASKNQSTYSIKASLVDGPHGVEDAAPVPTSKSFVQPPTVSQVAVVQSSAKSSTQALETEVARALKRAASVTGRQNAPSTLLAVSFTLPPKMARPVWSLRDYAVVEKMYTGYASNVYKAFCKFSGETVCLKAYSLGNVCELNRVQIFREVQLHSSLSHEHVIKLYGAFQQGDQVVLVQEFAESGDLFNILQWYGGRMAERTAVELVLYPFLSAINYLHSNGIAHRDIKPENILFTADMRLKLCDFGLAINMRDERAVTRAGTLEYMAPEVLSCPYKNKPQENKEKAELHYSFHVDTWAAGVLTYELLVGMPPFSDKQRNIVEDKIRTEVPRFPSRMSELAKQFITLALEKDPLERPTVVDMVAHRWVRMHRRSLSVHQLKVQPTSQSSVTTPRDEADEALSGLNRQG